MLLPSDVLFVSGVLLLRRLDEHFPKVLPLLDVSRSPRETSRTSWQLRFGLLAPCARVRGLSGVLSVLCPNSPLLLQSLPPFAQLRRPGVLPPHELGERLPDALAAVAWKAQGQMVFAID